MDHDDAYALIALGAAGALSADEYRALEKLLAADPALAAEYRELEEIVSVLADASSESPPPSLRSSVLDAVRNIDQLPPVTAEGTLRDVHDDTPESVSVDVVTLDAQFSPAPAPEPETDRGLAPVVPIRHRRWMVPATAAAAIVMLLVAGLLVNRFADAPGGGDRISAVLDDEDALTIPMEPQVDGFDGFDIVYSAAEGAAVLTAEGLPVPLGENVYELWAIRGADAPERVEIFRPDEGGDVELLLVGIDPASATWAITEEPAGGSDAPTEPILAITA